METARNTAGYTYAVDPLKLFLTITMLSPTLLCVLGYRSTPEPSLSSLGSTGDDERVAVFDFVAVEAGDLTVHTGDIVHVVQSINADWLKCRHDATGTYRSCSCQLLVTSRHWQKQSAAAGRSDQLASATRRR